MLARLSAFVIWALVAATAVFWGLRLIVRAPSAPERTVVVGDANATRGDWSRLLGAAPVTPTTVRATDANSRFKLLGIVAPKDNSETDATKGVALIAVDGKMPHAYVVGAPIDGDMMLQSVSLRTASIGAGPGLAAITLELPPPIAAAIGKLPAGGATTAQAPIAPPQMAPPVASVIVPASMTAQGMPVPAQGMPVQRQEPSGLAPPPQGAASMPAPTSQP